MIRVLIVDDEAPARAKLRRLLAAEPDFEVAGEAADGVEAVAAIRRLCPDVVFLDVRMPRCGGLDVVEAVGVEAMPLTVFVTAYDQHAVRAFEVQALDYLLKPFAPQRFERLLQRVRRRLEEEGSGPLARRLELLLATQPARRPLRRLTARLGTEREVFVAAEEIDLVRAEANYLRLFTSRGELTLRGTLTGLEARLDPEQFLRINRAELIRLDAVVELQPWFHGDYRVRLADGRTLMWSRRYRARWRAQQGEGA